MSAAEPVQIPEARPMRDSDLDIVMDIEGTSFSTPWSRTSFRNLLRRGDSDLWVAVVDRSVVGYAVVWYVGKDAELGNIAIAPGWRRHGLGRWLLEWAVQKARQRGAERIFLEVRMSNRGAQALYESHGFLQVGIRRRYYRAPAEDARVMCLDLTRAE